MPNAKQYSKQMTNNIPNKCQTPNNKANKCQTI